MANTTNYNWETPDDTDLVKDGASAIRSLGTAIDTTVFNNASAAIAKTIVDAKGDIIAATAADTVARLAVGANDTVLTADTSTPTGLKWAAPAGGKVLQVLNFTYAVETTNSTNTFADTGVTLSITPSSATSKILVTVFQSGIAKSANNNDGQFKLVRGVTDLAIFEAAAPYTNSALTLNPGATGITYLDSPATTSSTTYKTQFKNNVNGTGTITAQYGNSTATITLMEIGA
jgi:hypothetical protein